VPRLSRTCWWGILWTRNMSRHLLLPYWNPLLSHDEGEEMHQLWKEIWTLISWFQLHSLITFDLIKKLCFSCVVLVSCIHFIMIQFSLMQKIIKSKLTWYLLKCLSFTINIWYHGFNISMLKLSCHWIIRRCLIFQSTIATYCILIQLVKRIILIKYNHVWKVRWCIFLKTVSSNVMILEDARTQTVKEIFKKDSRF